MQRRGWLFGGAAVLGFCVLACILVFVAGLPAFRDEVRGGVHNAVATEIARQIPTTAGAAQPGAYTLSAADLEASLRDNLDDEESDDQDLIIRISESRIEIGITSQGQDAIYTGTPTANAGELDMRDMDTDNGFVGFLLPPDTIGGAVEDAVNDYLSANSLHLDSVELAEDQLTLVVSQA